MKKLPRRLSLRTETLVPLTTSQLAAVAGGGMNARPASMNQTECASCASLGAA
jgi:hypothetical protein